MNEYKVHENQTLQDVSAHVYGRVDIAMDLALLNNISITEKLTAGQLLKLVDSPTNTLVKKVLDSRNIIPAVDFEGVGFEIPELGIGTMAIGSTFIVR